MHPIAIGRRLVIEEDPRGATLTCRPDAGGTGTVFQVGISHDSLLRFNEELTKRGCLWNISDGSLSAYGDSEELTLTFCSCRAPFLESSVSLFGDDLKAFKWAVHAVASRLSMVLN